MPSPRQPVPAPLRQALPWLLLVTSIFFFNFINRLIFAPLLPVIEADLGLSHGQAGRLFLYLSAGYAVALPMSGFFACRLKHRIVIGLSSIIMGLAIIGTGMATDPAWFPPLLFGLGFGGGLYLPSGIAALTALTRKEDYGKALSIHELAPNFSFILAPLVAEALLLFGSWRLAPIVLGVGSVLAGLLFIMFGRGGEGYGTKPSFSALNTLVRMPAFWLMSFLFTVGVGSSFGPYTMLPLFLMEDKGFTQVEASHLLALSRMCGPLAALATGIIVDKLGPMRTLVGSLLINAILTGLIGYCEGSLLVAVAIVQPVVTVTFFTPTFTLLNTCFPPYLRSLAISMVIPVGIMCGTGGVPSIIGSLGDAGQFGLAFMALGALLALGLLALKFLSRQECSCE